jgi:hypothetical protein
VKRKKDETAAFLRTVKKVEVRELKSSRGGMPKQPRCVGIIRAEGAGFVVIPKGLSYWHRDPHGLRSGLRMLSG